MTAKQEKEFIETCLGCGETKECCQDFYCRECHKSLGFDECVDGSWVAEQRRAAGL